MFLHEARLEVIAQGLEVFARGKAYVLAYSKALGACTGKVYVLAWARIELYFIFCWDMIPTTT